MKVSVRVSVSESDYVSVYFRHDFGKMLIPRIRDPTLDCLECL